MSLRLQKALVSLGSTVAIIAVAWLAGSINPGWHVRWQFQLVLLATGLVKAGYEWWKFGDSPRAVALRAKEEARGEIRNWW
ncbi:hypothetical protein [Streptacidiphilus rugosus]|uniref:hypothetical protein n=1 Tax=Streptacidiphilus rugosus TaxID=405783 RepID=UPI00055BADA7|nr:hypothetical protein [Streptacidiphilus rugosus]